VADQRDQDTRDRLLSEGARLFAERGFAKVTVRDICQRAGANVAAINYHFGGKVGLYDQIMRSAIEIMQATTTLAREAGAGLPAEGRLRAYIRVFIERIVGGGRQSWIHQLMLREISEPTPALDRVIDQVLRPRMEYLGEIVAAQLQCPKDDERVGRCAMSVHAQCVALMNASVAERMNPALRISPERLEALIEHITRFSLAGIAASRPSG
jgi:AcrR family transcriptional regulator